MSDLNVGDWVKSTQSGFRGKISSIHHIGDNDWAVLRIPFDEDVTYTARLGELVPCDPVVKPPKTKYVQPPDPRTEKFIHRRRSGDTAVTVVRRNTGSRGITWPEGPAPSSQDKWGWYDRPSKRRPVVVKPKREKFDTAELINEEVRKSSQKRDSSTPRKRQPILKPRRLVIRPKSDE